MSDEWIAPYKSANNFGYLFTGAGGGFLMVVADEKPVGDSFQICIDSEGSFWDK